MTDRKTWPLALSIHPEDTEERKLAELSESGIHQAELSMPLVDDVYGSFDFPSRFCDIRKKALDYGVDINSVHLPYCGIAPESPDIETRLETVRIQREIISAAADAGVNKCIIHPSVSSVPSSLLF